MAVAYFHEWPGATTEMGQEVINRINTQLGNAAPQGSIFHVDGEADNGWWGFDVWESEDAARRFYEDILSPAAEAVGLSTNQPKPLSVHWHSLETPTAAG